MPDLNPPPKNGRLHIDSITCWCAPLVFEVCEECEPRNNADCPRCAGKNLVLLEGVDRVDAVIRLGLDEPDMPTLVIVHLDQTTPGRVNIEAHLVTPCDELDPDAAADELEPEPWSRNPDEWRG